MDDVVRGWQRPKRGESETKRMDRVMHSCCHCGWQQADMDKVDKHEQSCNKADDK